MALGELLAVRPVQQRKVRVDRRLGAQRLVDPHVLGRIGVVVRAAHDMRDAGVVVVDHDGEVVDRRAVGARDHEVVLQDVLERALAADDVVDDRRALVGHPQAHGALALVLAAEAAVAVGLLEGLDLARGRPSCGTPARSRAAAGRPRRGASAFVGLVDRALVPVDPEPLEAVEDQLDVLGRRALAVGVLDAQDELAARAPGQEPVVQCRPRVADVQRAGRRWRKAHAHDSHHPMLIGAHVSPAGGPANAVERGEERGCRSIQIFNQSPRAWKARVYSDEEVAAFHEAMEGSQTSRRW